MKEKKKIHKPAPNRARISPWCGGGTFICVRRLKAHNNYGAIVSACGGSRWEFGVHRGRMFPRFHPAPFRCAVFFFFAIVAIFFSLYGRARKTWRFRGPASTPCGSSVCGCASYFLHHGANLAVNLFIESFAVGYRRRIFATATVPDRWVGGFVHPEAIWSRKIALAASAARSACIRRGFSRSRGQPRLKHPTPFVFDAIRERAGDHSTTPGVLR